MTYPIKPRKSEVQSKDGTDYKWPSESSKPLARRRVKACGHLGARCVLWGARYGFSPCPSPLRKRRAPVLAPRVLIVHVCSRFYLVHCRSLGWQVDACARAGVPPREPPAARATAVRLKWIHRDCGSYGDSLRLESVELLEAPLLEQAQPASRVSIEAAALLASIAAPSLAATDLVVTATVPLRLCESERGVLLPLTPSLAQCQVAAGDDLAPEP